jgi:hypothetical protein
MGFVGTWQYAPGSKTTWTCEDGTSLIANVDSVIVSFVEHDGVLTEYANGGCAVKFQVNDADHASVQPGQMWSSYWGIDSTPDAVTLPMDYLILSGDTIVENGTRHAQRTSTTCYEAIQLSMERL